MAGRNQGFRLVQADQGSFGAPGSRGAYSGHALGHPAEKRPTPHTWEESKIHYDKWTK